MKDHWLISREAIEQNYGAITDDEFAIVADEVAGRVDNFIEEILDGIMAGIVESKFDKAIEEAKN
jgi:hypothetical protein